LRGEPPATSAEESGQVKSTLAVWSEATENAEQDVPAVSPACAAKRLLPAQKKAAK
jgi:hypothetical protein